ncbi:MAG: M48 family metalloprotease, partial [Janthinobacterium lividum]
MALLLPAALVAVGAWQVTRVAGTAEGFTRRAGQVQASIERIQPLAARDPGAVVRFGNDPQSHTAAQALGLMQGAQSDLRRNAAVEQARQAAAWTTAGGGVVALVAVLGCLAAARLGAWRGRRSRDALVGAFRVVVRLLPPLLGLVAVATAVSIIGAVLFEAGGIWFQDTISTNDIKLILAGILMAGGGVLLAFNSVRQLRRVLHAFTPDPLRVLGRAVGPDAGPGLFAFIQQIAAGQGAAPPDNLVLGMTEGFFVTSSPILLLPEHRAITGRSLYLPAPFLPLLSRGEVASIVAHELAHFTGDDTAYSQHFLPLYAGMARSMDAVTSRTPAKGWLGAAFQPAAILARHVMDTFSHTVARWSRLRELEADRAALKHESGQTAASALVRTGIGAGLIGGAVGEMYDRPDQVDADLVGAV